MTTVFPTLPCTSRAARFLRFRFIFPPLYNAALHVPFTIHKPTRHRINAISYVYTRTPRKNRSCKKCERFSCRCAFMERVFYDVIFLFLYTYITSVGPYLFRRTKTTKTRFLFDGCFKIVFCFHVP